MDSRSPAPDGPFQPLRKRCSDALELNLLQGCGCDCLACPHGEPTPPAEQQATFDNHAGSRTAFDSPEALGLDRTLPTQVVRWLAEHREDRPRFVTVGFSTEPLPGFDEVVTVLIDSLKPLLAAGVGVSLQTRRLIPEPLLDLLGEHAANVRVSIPLPFLSDDELRIWEPRTASARQRLFNVQQLRLRQIPVSVSIKPLIPYVNDDQEHLGPLLRAVSDAGVKRISAEFMRLTQASRKRMESHSPVSTQLVFGAYVERQMDRREDRSRPDVARRQRAYQRLARLARQNRIRFALCRCADPVLGRDPCLLWPGDARAPARQPSRDERVRGRRRPPRRGGQVGFSDLLDSKQ